MSYRLCRLFSELISGKATAAEEEFGALHGRVLDGYGRPSRAVVVMMYLVVAIVFRTGLVVTAGGGVSFGQGQFTRYQAGDLVRTVRSRESWLDGVESLELRFESQLIRSRLSIAVARTQLQRQFPDSALNEERCIELRPSMHETGLLAFDASRLRREIYWQNAWDCIFVWNGKVLFDHSKYRTHEQESYSLVKAPDAAGNRFWSCLAWPLVSPLSFWFCPRRDREFYDQEFGDPVGSEDFDIQTIEEYGGRRCYVLQLNGADFQRWYIGVADGHLYRHMTGTSGLRGGNQALLAFAKELAGRDGQAISDGSEVMKWLGQLPQERRQAIERELLHNERELSLPVFDSSFDDYEQLKPGWWIPRKQKLVTYSGYDDQQGNEIGPFVSLTKEIRITSVRVDEALADDVLEYAVQDGVQVVDHRHDVPLIYEYQASRTAEEFEQLIVNARMNRKEDNERQQKLDALVGQSPPDFSADATWLNSDPLTWEALRGKTVIIDFWAEWCGPCRNDLPILASLYKKGGESEFLVVGIHTPGSKLSSIQEFMKNFEITYPVCIDVAAGDGADSWGEMFSAYQVFGLPHAFLIDCDGKIAAHGCLTEVLTRRNDLVAR